VAKAYKSLALRWHPDKAGADDDLKKEAEEKFKEINAAFEALSDEKQREFYDFGRAKAELLFNKSNTMPKQLQKMGFRGPKLGDGLTTCMICGLECKLTSEKQWHIKFNDHPGFYDEEAAARVFGRQRR